jgi:hypothetical protein
MAPVQTSTAHASHKSVGCPAPHAHVIVANVQTTLYEAAPAGDLPEYLHLFGCVSGHPTPSDLGPVPECGLFESCGGQAECTSSRTCGGVRRAVLAGTAVAYETFFTGEEEARWYVAVRDLRSGRLLRHVATGVPLKQSPHYVGVGPIAELVVKPDGSVAWIASDLERSEQAAEGSSQAHYFDLYAADKSGTRLLASGLNLSPSSLALAGSTLYWTQGGKPFSATLN